MHGLGGSAELELHGFPKKWHLTANMTFQPEKNI
jgi:hypothetical protein